jgi:ribonuclease VapC
MFIDASARLALLLQEPEAEDMAEAIEATSRCITSPIAIYEAVARISTLKRLAPAVAEIELRSVLAAAAIEIVPLTDEIGRTAVEAFERYGKGRGHPAQLNMGDCFAYACARVHGVKLLYKGDDFARTDLA